VSEPVQFRAPVGSKRRWRAAAKRAQRNLSDWIRVTLDEASQDVVVDEDPDEAGEGHVPPAPAVAVSSPSETRQAQALATDVPAPAATTGKLAANCTNKDMHWRLKRGERCRFCGGVA
jgi:hypothetical protein